MNPKVDRLSWMRSGVGLPLASVAILICGCALVAPKPVMAPQTIAQNRVCIRGSVSPESNGSFGLRRANGDEVFRHETEGTYWIWLNAGRNVLDVRINEGSAEEGRFEGWILDLSGGSAYVVKGTVAGASATVWIEDAKTAKVVSDTISVPLFPQ